MRLCRISFQLESFFVAAVSDLALLGPTVNESMNVKPVGQHRKPVQARAEDTRAKILTEARKAFAERGFDAANTRDIADAAGVTHPMIRYHFGTKDQLWREAVRDMFATLEEALRPQSKAEEDLPGYETYRLFIRRYVRYCAEHPEHARIMVSETVRGGDRLEWLVSEFLSPKIEILRPVANTLVEEGKLPDLWPVSMRYIIAAACQAPFTLAAEVRALYGVDMFTEEAIEAHTDSVLRLLFRDADRA